MANTISREDIVEKITCARAAQEAIFNQRQALIKQTEALLADEKRMFAKVGRYEKALAQFDFMVDEIKKGMSE